ncbi:unnamed protein product, partial [Choristocarpus tenellus]
MYVGLSQIPRTADFILKGGFRRVALQFPDALLPEAPEVLWALQGMLRKAIGEGMRLGGGDVGDAGVEGLEGLPLIFVTGDTSYGSCCVDEVSAQHLKADAIVHYAHLRSKTSYTPTGNKTKHSTTMSTYQGQVVLASVPQQLKYLCCMCLAKETWMSQI